MKELLDRTRAATKFTLVSLDEVADELEALAARPTDDPEERAILRAGFDAALFGLDPPLTPIDMEALRHNLRREPWPTRQEQLRWGLKAHRVRARLRAAVTDLLAPVVVAMGNVAARARRRLADGPSALGLAGSFAAVAVPAIVVAAAMPSHVPAAAARVSARASAITPRPTRPDDVALAGPADRVSPAATARPVIERASGLTAPSSPPVYVTTSTAIRRDAAAAAATNEVSFHLGPTDRSTGNDLAVTIYCDSTLRAAVCAAVSSAEPAMGGAP